MGKNSFLRNHILRFLFHTISLVATLVAYRVGEFDFGVVAAGVFVLLDIVYILLVLNKRRNRIRGTTRSAHIVMLEGPESSPIHSKTGHGHRSPGMMSLNNSAENAEVHRPHEEYDEEEDEEDDSTNVKAASPSILLPSFQANNFHNLSHMSLSSGGTPLSPSNLLFIPQDASDHSRTSIEDFTSAQSIPDAVIVTTHAPSVRGLQADVDAFHLSKEFHKHVFKHLPPDGCTVLTVEPGLVITLWVPHKNVSAPLRAVRWALDYEDILIEEVELLVTVSITMSNLVSWKSSSTPLGDIFLVHLGSCYEDAAYIADLCVNLGTRVLITSTARHAVDPSQPIRFTPVDVVRTPRGPFALSEDMFVYEVRRKFESANNVFNMAQKIDDAMLHTLQHFRLKEFDEALKLLKGVEQAEEPQAERLWALLSFFVKGNNHSVLSTPYYRTHRGWDHYEAMAGAPVPDIELSQSASSNSTHTKRKSLSVSITEEGDFVRRQMESARLMMTRSQRSSIESSTGPLAKEFKDRKDRTWNVSNRLLGKGATARVYLGMSDDGTFVAIKQMNFRQLESIEALIQEVTTMSALRHENIVAYLGCGVLNSDLLIVQEYVSGGTLLSVVNDFGFMSLKTLRRFSKDILTGLAFLHSKGIVHRDVKPQNVLVTITGCCKLADFGTSTKQSTSTGESWGNSSLYHSSPTLDVGGGGTAAFASQDRTIIGTPAYMAPEQARGKPCRESDLWAFAVTLLHLATGVIPWDDDVLGQQVRLMAMLAYDDAMKPRIPSHLEPSLVELLEACFAREPSLRPSATSLLSYPFFTNPAE